MLNEKLFLVDDDENPLKKVDYPVNSDNDSKVEEVFNETAVFMASTSLNSGCGSESGYDDLHDDEVIVDMGVSEKQEKSAKIDEREVSTCVKDSVAPTIPVTTADEGVTAAKINEITPTSAPTIVIDELTLAQTLIEIKAAKPKVVTTVATTTTTRPKARGVVVQGRSEFRTTTSSPHASQPSKTKDKGKAIMIKPEVPLKRKDQVALDEEMAR
ncbi:hypothetical protein Tco_0818165, partial [Tanacetum coccineum]